MTFETNASIELEEKTLNGSANSTPSANIASQPPFRVRTPKVAPIRLIASVSYNWITSAA